MQPILYHLHALSPLHCGIGQAADVVDLPIARSRATKLPIVPNSSLRGVLRQSISDDDPDFAKNLFGTGSKAGDLSVGDGNLLLLPVRCLAGIVSYVTSPFILRRYRRDGVIAGENWPAVPECKKADRALVVPKSVNCIDEKLVLEDLDLQAEQSAEAERWAEIVAGLVHADDQQARGDLICRFAILSDNVMQHLAETATEIRTRIAIDPRKGTAREGALWHEEALPAESVLWGLMASTRDGAQGNLARLPGVLSPGKTLQVGGNAGIGAGLVRLLLVGEG